MQWKSFYLRFKEMSLHSIISCSYCFSKCPLQLAWPKT